MFCTTFYSYKGGVGRTLALANVAVALAQRKKKVLVVDFDLEAPGLSTLSIFSEARGKRGVVEFVQKFSETAIVDDVAGYICSCTFEDPFSESAAALSIDVMPAGSDGEYPNSFSNIDWNRLYAQQSGFLLMEDMRQQWGALGYDYVLLDSRTGLTDVGGICTRQLPDSVVVVFFPNEQNLAGLKKIVPEIRNSSARGKSIELLFAASRLPKLDDEDEILKGWLDKFKKELEYDDDRYCRIDHYDSLDLLDQQVFTLSRQKSRLARQYMRLANVVARDNAEDPDGAFDFIVNLLSSQGSPKVGKGPNLELDDKNKAKIQDVGNLHGEDYVIQFLLTDLYLHELVDLDLAAAASANALVLFGSTRVTRPFRGITLARLHELRIQIFSELADDGVVLGSADAILDDASAPESAILSALIAYARKAPDRLSDPSKRTAIATLNSAQLATIARRLSTLPNGPALGAKVAALSVGREDTTISSADAYEMVNVLISGKQFDEAIKASSFVKGDQPIEIIGKLFNCAMAKWGRDGTPDRDDFEEVLKRAPEAESYQDEPNFVQCLALSAGAIGNTELSVRLALRAIDLIKAKAVRQFSCWTYSAVSPDKFEEHCEAIISYSNGVGPGPPAVI